MQIQFRGKTNNLLKTREKLFHFPFYFTSKINCENQRNSEGFATFNI